MYRRHLLSAVAALPMVALLAASSFAADWDVTLMGGVGIPMGTFEGASPGLRAQRGPELCLGIFHDVRHPLALGLEGSWYQNHTALEQNPRVSKDELHLWRRAAHDAVAIGDRLRRPHRSRGTS